MSYASHLQFHKLDLKNLRPPPFYKVRNCILNCQTLLNELGITGMQEPLFSSMKNSVELRMNLKEKWNLLMVEKIRQDCVCQFHCGWEDRPTDRLSEKQEPIAHKSIDYLINKIQCSYQFIDCFLKIFGHDDNSINMATDEMTRNWTVEKSQMKTGEKRKVWV